MKHNRDLLAMEEEDDYGDERPERDYQSKPSDIQTNEYFSNGIIQEVDEGTISPPMNYENWRDKRLKKIDEFSKLISSNQQ